MICGAVLADRTLGVVHYADWPDPPPCPWAVPVILDDYGAAGRRWAAVPCSLPARHPPPCQPQHAGRWGPDTLCGIEMPPGEPWIPFRPTTDDPICPQCRRRLPR